jgi:uncharacterized OB-fold protein
LPAALLLDCAEVGPTSLVVSAGGVTHALRFEPGPGFAAAWSAARAVLAAGVDGAPTSVGQVPGFDPYSSNARAWRDRHQDLNLAGVRCLDCGRVLFPAPPVCPHDGPAAKLEPWRLGRTGTVLTFTRDHLFPLGAPIIMCVIDIDGGGRFYGQTAGVRPFASATASGSSHDCCTKAAAVPSTSGRCSLCRTTRSGLRGRLSMPIAGGRDRRRRHHAIRRVARSLVPVPTRRGRHRRGRGWSRPQGGPSGVAGDR